MNLSDITTKPWILALFKRDDGERFLLGDGFYDFKDSLQHFQPNSMSNDIVELQGTDGQLLAGQVRRSGTQSFDGYIGDGTTNKQIVEQRRKAFLMFFRKKHYYTVVYIFCDGTAIKRERGYLVDAPSVPEIRQKSPEYHVALNFENVNYYEYAENAQGDEIYSNVREIVVSNLISGGLVWDALGAVSDAIQWGAYTTESGSFITLNDAIQNAPMSLTQIKGNAEQNGTPTPDAPVPVDAVTGGQNIFVENGKNLWNGEFRQGSKDAINIATRIYSTQVLKVESGVTYTISSSLDYSAFVFAVNMRPEPYGTMVSYDSGWKTNSFTFTPAQDGYFGVIIARSDFVSNLTPSDIDGVNFQLEKSNSASPYEPYVATNQEINLGKNLTDLSTFTFGYVAATGVVNTGSHPMGEMVSPFIKVTPSTAYTFKIVETTGTNDSWFGVGEYTSESTSSFVRRDTNTITTATSITFMTSATTNYIMVSARNLEQATKVQLEKGFQATSWAEYFTPIELAKVGTYQDRIYKNDDKWYIEKQVGKVVYDGTQNWAGEASTGSPSFLYAHNSTIDSLSKWDEPQGISDYFTIESTPLAIGSVKTAPCMSLSTANVWQSYHVRVLVPLTLASTPADFKTWLSTHPTTVYYALATPTDTEITDETLLEQLEHIYQLYGGVNNISIVGTGNGSIEISYATELNPGGGFVWEDGGTGGLTTITIDAVDLTLPVWTITGPATNPTLSNITTGQTMSWLGTVPNGQTLIIDMNEQTATMAGANVYAFLSGNWVGLAPGTNRISYSVTGTDESSTLSWNNIVG